MYKILYVLTADSNSTEKEILLTLLNSYDRDKWCIKVAVPLRSSFVPYIQKSATEYFEYDDENIAVFKELFLAEKPDIIHATFLKPVLDAAKKLRIPVVCSKYDAECRETKGISYLKEKLYNYRKVRHLIVSDKEAKGAVNFSEKRISFITPGVTATERYDDEKIKKMRAFYGLNDEDFVFVTFTDMDGCGGHDCILNSAKLLKESNPEAKIFICGTGHQSEEIRNYIKTSELSKNVMFLGNVRDTASVLNVSDAVIDASSVSKSHDSKILEGLSIGLPVILSDCHKNKLGASELYFKTGNMKMLAEKMCFLLNRKDEYLKMCEKSVEAYKSSYTGKIMAEKIEKVYFDIVKR